MSTIRVASRYAGSLLELSVEKGQLEAVHQDMNRLMELAASNEDLKVVLQSPVISAETKINVLKALFEKSNTPLTASFFNLLAQKGREGMVLNIAKEFHKQYNIYNKIQEAKVVTTFALNEHLRESFIKVIKEVSGREKVELVEKVDEELIGGFVLTVGDKQIDESLSSKLSELKLKFTQNLYEKKY